jgi:secreted Zn-dependent insulinase-like peptidase
MLMSMLNNKVQREFYSASVAGIDMNFSSSWRGISVGASGWSPKLRSFMTKAHEWLGDLDNSVLKER